LEVHVPSSISLLGFVAAALVILLIPGPGVLYVVARSIEQGRRAGLVSVLGLSTGVFVHIAAAVAGISAVLLASATAFGIIKTLGAGYLIYLGLRALIARRTADGIETTVPRATHRLFMDGVFVSILNPKIAVFFIAFLPQFAEPSRGPIPQQILLLGLIYVALALITDSGYALLADRVRHLLGGRIARGSLPRYVSASVYLGLGVGTALTGQRN
jgi:threonine/homoserine/homoserine lactone efflux protein